MENKTTKKFRFTSSFGYGDFIFKNKIEAGSKEYRELKAEEENFVKTAESFVNEDLMTIAWVPTSCYHHTCLISYLKAGKTDSSKERHTKYNLTEKIGNVIILDEKKYYKLFNGSKLIIDNFIRKLPAKMFDAFYNLDIDGAIVIPSNKVDYFKNKFSQFNCVYHTI